MYRLTRISLAHPWATLVVIGLITAFFAAGLPRLHTEFGYRVLVGDKHPSITMLDQFIDEFGGGLPTQIAWECGATKRCASVFDHSSLRMAEAITRSLSPLDGVRAIQGPNNAPLIVPIEGGFSVRRFVENGAPVPDLDELARRALNEPLWVGDLISADGSVGAIIVQAADNESETDVRLVKAILATVAPFEKQGFSFYLVGDSIATVIPGWELDASMARLIPILVLIIGVILQALSQCWQYTVTALFTLGIALLWTFGLLGWLNWPQDGVLEVLAPLILVVGVCDAVHLLSRHTAELTHHADPSGRKNWKAALLKSAKDVSAPCLLTTLTTAGALASFATSALDTFVRFGLISAVGVSLCLLLTFSLLPVTVCLLPRARSRMDHTPERWEFALRAIVAASQRRAVPILAASAALFVVCAVGWLLYLRVDNNWLQSFGEKSQAVQWIRFVEERLRPVDSLEIEIGLPSGDALVNPQTLIKVSEFSEYLSSIEGLGATKSVLNLIKRVNRFLHDDDPAYERIGESEEANSEIIELIGFDDPGALANWLSLDRTRLRISVEASERSYVNRAKILRSVEDHVRSTIPESWRVSLSGALAINFDWVRDVQGTQLRSFPTALALVFAMVWLFLGSLRLSVAAMIPTILPIVVTLGAMGWMGMSLDIGRAMIAAILIGIAVDDSIHILGYYNTCRRNGVSSHSAIESAIHGVGQAVVTTSVALALGFLTLMASAWQTISSFGFFVALAILGALAAVLFVLPALIFVFARRE